MAPLKLFRFWSSLPKTPGTVPHTAPPQNPIEHFRSQAGNGSLAGPSYWHQHYGLPQLRLIRENSWNSTRNSPRAKLRPLSLFLLYEDLARIRRQISRAQTRGATFANLAVFARDCFLPSSLARPPAFLPLFPARLPRSSHAGPLPAGIIWSPAMDVPSAGQFPAAGLGLAAGDARRVPCVSGLESARGPTPGPRGLGRVPLRACLPAGRHSVPRPRSPISPLPTPTPAGPCGTRCPAAPRVAAAGCQRLPGPPYCDTRDRERPTIFLCQPSPVCVQWGWGPQSSLLLSVTQPVVYATDWVGAPPALSLGPWKPNEGQSRPSISQPGSRSFFAVLSLLPCLPRSTKK
jgi:hypothetical protein